MKGTTIQDIEQMTKLLSGDASEQEADHVLDLMNSDPNKRRTFNALKREWEEANEVVHQEIVTLVRTEPRVERGLVHVPVGRISFSKLVFLKWSILGVLILVATLYFSEKNRVIENQLVIHSTGEREQKEISLDNGLVITLNENSLLSYISNENLFQIEGEAFFSIPIMTKDEITIDMPYTYITAQRASFYVSSADENQVHVERGMAELAMKVDKQALRVRAGQAGVYRGPFPLSLKSSDVNDLAWFTKKMIFNDSRFSEALKVIESVYHIHFIFDTSIYEHCKLTATFSNDSLENVLHSLTLLYDIDFTVNENAYIITGKSCDSTNVAD